MGAACSRSKPFVQVRSAISRKRHSDDIRNYYRIGHILGSGSFGQVRECTHRITGTVYAVKVMEKKIKDTTSARPTNESMMRCEIEILKILDHPHIITFHDFFEDKHFFYAVLEKCEGGELFYHIAKRRAFSEEDATILCKQMLGSLEYLHSLSIVHRDIKAENFLFKTKDLSSPLKLIDFGMSIMLPEGSLLSDLCGSPHYISPELIRKKYNIMADMWAFGVMIYLMLFGKYPFEGSKPGDIAREILTKELKWDTRECSHLTAEAIDFMKKILERNYKKRLTAANALKHPWIAESSLAAKKAGSIIPHEKLEFARRLSMDAEHISLSTEIIARRNSKLHKVEVEYMKGISTGRRVSFEEITPN